MKEKKTEKTGGRNKFPVEENVINLLLPVNVYLKTINHR